MSLLDFFNLCIGLTLMIRYVMRSLPYQYQPTNGPYSFIHQLRSVILIIDSLVENRFKRNMVRSRGSEFLWSGVGHNDKKVLTLLIHQER